MGCEGICSCCVQYVEGVRLAGGFLDLPPVLGCFCVPTDIGIGKRLCTEQHFDLDLRVVVLLQSLSPFDSSGLLGNGWCDAWTETGNRDSEKEIAVVVVVVVVVRTDSGPLSACNSLSSEQVHPRLPPSSEDPKAEPGCLHRSHSRISEQIRHALSCREGGLEKASLHDSL